MRQDTKVLLNRLGQETFKYYDFESPSTDTDVWPMFEALLLDERVVGPTARNAGPGHVAPEVQSPAPQPVPERSSERVTPAVVASAGERGLFGHYEPVGVPEDRGESVRELLGRLATPAR